MALKEFGWDDCWESYRENHSDEKIGRIIRVERGHMWVQTTTTQIACMLSGKFYHLASESIELPTIGDWCAMSEPFINESNQNAALIEELLPRKSWISRVASGSESKLQIMAANVDYAFIVSSSNTDFSSNRIKRYVLLAQAGNVTPVILLSKIDVDPDYQVKLAELQEKFVDLHILATRSDDRQSLSPLLDLLVPGKTAVLLGSSGVGKSTITNLLLQEQTQDTREVREGDDKGKHTTTNRQLFRIPNYGMIIDSPGLREVQIHAQQEDLDELFEDIVQLAYACKFSDCSHQNEPGCKIIAALDTAEIDPEHWQEYLKLQREIEFLERKTDVYKAQVEKKKWKKISADHQQRKKFKKNHS
ncbi:MAG: ribosome small subunit-dependent GTPase A [Bdellovibrionota bacterium]